MLCSPNLAFLIHAETWQPTPAPRSCEGTSLNVYIMGNYLKLPLTTTITTQPPTFMDTSIFTRPFTYLGCAGSGVLGAQSSGDLLVKQNITLDDTYDALDARHHPGNKRGPSEEWRKHCSSNREDTDTFLTTMLRDKYPDYSLIVTADWQVNILNLEGVAWKPLEGVELQSQVSFIAPSRRDQPARVARSIRFGGFDVWWKEERFIVFIASWSAGFGMTTQHFILKEGKDETASIGLLMAAGYQFGQIGDSILVFNDGYWQNDYALWEEVQKADWKDVILSPEFKQEIQSDVKNFFASEAIYHELAIYTFSPHYKNPGGNGKTISIKALMKSAKKPALYVKSFKSWMGEEGSMREVFGRARREAPCLLILEDLDALINDENRSFFLNEIDGLANNDGLFIIGTTNHFERLDPGLSDRPSRFDRKYTFALPNRVESLVEKVADLTTGFSFAYLKEAFDLLKKQIGNNDLAPILGATAYSV
ncbi:unnamed protein product [Rhizoctonia solani]|uniref:ATPase AAA-type core domain-containing protein n=1 Tax=Rhizoctonia solani TaxID=456999 RepID=A0A8H2Y414_9AGAM|nr:unnamed protein product [Rhizoctonia solani]